MKLKLTILGIVVLAAAGLFLVLWSNSPERQVQKKAHRLFKCLEKGALSAETISEKVDFLEKLVSPSCEVEAPYPVTSGTLNHSQAGRSLREFHASIISCKIRREADLITFISEHAGSYETELSVDISLGPRRQHHLRYQCYIGFIRSGKEWLAREFRLNPM